MFSTLELVTAQRSILGPPAEGRPGPSVTKISTYALWWKKAGSIQLLRIPRDLCHPGLWHIKYGDVPLRNVARLPNSYTEFLFEGVSLKTNWMQKSQKCSVGKCKLTWLQSVYPDNNLLNLTPLRSKNTETFNRLLICPDVSLLGESSLWHYENECHQFSKFLMKFFFIIN